MIAEELVAAALTNLVNWSRGENPIPVGGPIFWSIANWSTEESPQFTNLRLLFPGAAEVIGASATAIHPVPAKDSPIFRIVLEMDYLGGNGRLIVTFADGGVIRYRIDIPTQLPSPADAIVAFGDRPDRVGNLLPPFYRDAEIILSSLGLSVVNTGDGPALEYADMELQARKKPEPPHIPKVGTIPLFPPEEEPYWLPNYAPIRIDLESTDLALTWSGDAPTAALLSGWAEIGACSFEITCAGPPFLLLEGAQFLPETEQEKDEARMKVADLLTMGLAVEDLFEGITDLELVEGAFSYSFEENDFFKQFNFNAESVSGSIVHGVPLGGLRLELTGFLMGGLVLTGFCVRGLSMVTGRRRWFQVFGEKRFNGSWDLQVCASRFRLAWNLPKLPPLLSLFQRLPEAYAPVLNVQESAPNRIFLPHQRLGTDTASGDSLSIPEPKKLGSKVPIDDEGEFHDEF
ncbi:MAG: hypothetical protein JNM66_04590 [Bryobacterales bacterium]|nr:hypothetical protein [Bryobacterales bacterium]